MLRAGYLQSDVMAELRTRRFVGGCDEAARKMLTLAGASPTFIDALANGSFNLSPEEAARAKAALDQRTTDDAKRRAAMAAESRQFDTLEQDRIARQRAAAQTATPAGHAFLPWLKGDLVGFKDGSTFHFDDAALEKKKLIALYFSAHWCIPCRKFTPQLVEYYKRVAPQHPEFEIIFVSLDRALFNFETYMAEAQMPWPAIAYDKVREKTEILRYAGHGIPDLVLVDEAGKVVSDSYNGSEYLGPQKVMADLDALFARGADQLAQSP